MQYSRHWNIECHDIRSKIDTISGLRRCRYIAILFRYWCLPDIGYTRYRVRSDIGYTRNRIYANVGILRYYADIGVHPMSGIPDIGCTPISGIIEISTDIGVDIAIYRDRRTIRRYRCSARIQMTYRPAAFKYPSATTYRPAAFTGGVGLGELGSAGHWYKSHP